MSIGGLASGLDVNGIIEQLMALERRPITLMQKRQLELEAQQGAWRDVNTRLKNLDGKFSNLKLQSTYLSKAASVSNDKIITASAGTNAAVGTYQIKVDKLATGMTQRSERVTDATTALSATGTISITNQGKTWAVDVGIDDSLQVIAKKINDAQLADKTAIPVSATVIDNHLVLNGKGTGTDSTFVVEVTGSVSDKLVNKSIEPTNTGLTTIQSAENGKVTINGIVIDGLQSNTLKDAIQGVTLNLLEAPATTDAPIRLTVSQDTEKVAKAVQELVDQYNSTMEFIASKLAKDKGDLKGDGTLIRLQSSLRQMVSSRSSYTEGKYVTLADVGVSTAAWNKDAPDLVGKLTLDTAKLTEALKANPLAVKDILFKETNVALGSTITGSEYSSSYPLQSVIDGVTDPTNWGNGQGWNSVGPANGAEFTLMFSEPKVLDRLKLTTLDSALYPAAQYGLSGYSLFYLDENMVEHELDGISGNTQGSINQYLSSVKAKGLRFEFTGSNGGETDYARVIEVEAYENSGVLYNVERYIESFVQAGDGILSEKDKSYANQIKDIQDQIERMEDRLEMRQQSLVRQYTALEKALSGMQSQSNWLAGQIGQLPSWDRSQQ